MDEAKNSALRVLLVEDSEPDKVLALALLEKNYPEGRFSAVGSIKQASEALQKNDFDLVILDLNLPDGFGAENVKILKSRSQDTPIVILTALHDKETLEQCKSYGATALVPKEQMLSEDFSNVLNFAKKRG